MAECLIFHGSWSSGRDADDPGIVSFKCDGRTDHQVTIGDELIPLLIGQTTALTNGDYGVVPVEACRQWMLLHEDIVPRRPPGLKRNFVAPNTTTPRRTTRRCRRPMPPRSPSPVGQRKC